MTTSIKAGSETEEYKGSGGINCMEKQAILDEHNLLRQRIANGKLKGQPAGVNLRELVWDNELAELAQRWADQCMPGHDHIRNLDRFAVGQNVATTWTFDREPMDKDKPEFRRHIKAWFDEVNMFGFKPRHIDPFSFNMKTGHYTQMVWAETYMVGCGYSYYKDPARGLSKLYVCNYGPGGNLIGVPMYSIGFPGMETCKSLPDLSPSSRYLGLCEVQGARYIDHMCNDVLEPPTFVTPPTLMKPTPRPPKSIFHEMMGDNMISDVMSTSADMFMKMAHSGMQTTMNMAHGGMMLAHRGILNTMHMANKGIAGSMELVGQGLEAPAQMTNFGIKQMANMLAFMSG